MIILLIENDKTKWIDVKVNETPTGPPYNGPVKVSSKNAVTIKWLMKWLLINVSDCNATRASIVSATKPFPSLPNQIEYPANANATTDAECQINFRDFKWYMRFETRIEATVIWIINFPTNISLIVEHRLDKYTQPNAWINLWQHLSERSTDEAANGKRQR